MRENSSYPTLERPNVSGELWKLIWKLLVPNKVRNFLWRSCKNALLVKTSLTKRRILSSDSCDHCNEEPENVLHAHWKCSTISQVWRSVPKIDFNPPRNFTTISDLILHAQKDGKDMEKLAMVMWTIWHWRNQIRAKNEDYPISQVVPNAIQALQDFKRANHVAPPQSVTNAPPQTKWSPLPPNYLKVNFDSATFKDIGRAGLNVVMRDNHGQVIASLSEQVNLTFSCYRTYVLILCNWLILWQNALYLYLGKLRMCLTTLRNHVSRSSVEAFKSVQEIKQGVQIH